MKTWLYGNQIILTRLIGILLLVLSLVLFFWSTPEGNALSMEEQRAAERVARMEARVNGAVTSSPSVPKVDYAAAYTQHTQMQTRLLLILMVIIGVFFLAYSVIKKQKDSNP